MNVIDCKLKPDANAIEGLEQLLADARAGDIQGYVLAGANSLGEVTTSIAGDTPIFSLIGALESLKQVLLVGRCSDVRQAVQSTAAEID